MLARAATLYLAVELVHTADHLRQGITPTTGVAISGTANLLAAIAIFVLARRGDARTPLAAALFGAFAALGVTATHGLPEWGEMSFSYSGYGVDALSWAIAAALVAAGALLSAAGVAALREVRVAPAGEDVR